MKEQLELFDMKDVRISELYNQSPLSIVTRGHGLVPKGYDRREVAETVASTGIGLLEKMLADPDSDMAVRRRLDGSIIIKVHNRTPAEDLTVMIRPSLIKNKVYATIRAQYPNMTKLLGTLYEKFIRHMESMGYSGNSTLVHPPG